MVSSWPDHPPPVLVVETSRFSNCVLPLVKTKLKLHTFKSIFEKSAQSDVFKEMWVLTLKGMALETS